ncbi:MAG: hypothetical protein AAFV88_00865 [Planctomycetota bacterium]
MSDSQTTEDPSTVDSPTDRSVSSDPDIEAAKAAWEDVSEDMPEDNGSVVSDGELETASELAEPYVGRWNTLISTTNWEKGRIISQWRASLIESGVDATHYSDEAWSRRVGGVTAPHVGRLRRVFEKFGETYPTYEGLYWSHFLAALDWEDAPMWLEGASGEKWSISAMREKRWQAEGAVDSQRPTASQIIEVDTDEDMALPAQGDGKAREYDQDGSGVAAGPTFEGPDFGDEEELQTLGAGESGAPAAVADSEQSDATPVQPFLGLPALPDDLSDAVESMKLAILRHKTAGWRDTDQETIERYITAINVMIRS